MAEHGYKLGTWVKSYRSGRSLGIVFVVTQNCNLSCTYCYQTSKNPEGEMTFDVARRAVDYILAADFNDENVNFEFIGGEPFLMVDLVDQICDYIKLRLFEQNHRWRSKYSITISTNGLLYHTPKVQRFIKKNRHKLTIGMSIDGTPEKHDRARRFPDGRGSYAVVAQNAKLWLSQFPEVATKATFASEDLPYVKDSIVHLWNLGIKNIPANLVFEDVWKDGDELIFERQLRELADYSLEHDLWKTHICHFFSDKCGLPMRAQQRQRNWCTAGSKMLAIDHEGKIYPCMRFMKYSLSKREPVILGDLEHGIDPDRLRAFQLLDAQSQSTQKCLECEVATECAWCSAHNYDVSGSVYERATFICKMHKARVRANTYYFARLARKQRERMAPRYSQTLFFILDDNAVPVCAYEQGKGGGARMPEETFRAGLEFAIQNFYFPILMQPTAGPLFELPEGTPGWSALPAGRAAELGELPPDLLVYDDDVREVRPAQASLLMVSPENLPRLSGWIDALAPLTQRIMLYARDTHRFTAADRATYEAQLQKIAALYHDKWLSRGEQHEINVLTDRMKLTEMRNCNAGVKAFALAPNGLLYPCPAFYFADPSSAVGSLADGIDRGKLALYEPQRAPLCGSCDAYHCRRCVFDNMRHTGAPNIPAHAQCATSLLELKQSAALRDRLHHVSRELELHAPFTVRQPDPSTPKAILSK